MSDKTSKRRRNPYFGCSKRKRNRIYNVKRLNNWKEQSAEIKQEVCDIEDSVGWEDKYAVPIQESEFIFNDQSELENNVSNYVDIKCEWETGIGNGSGFDVHEENGVTDFDGDNFSIVNGHGDQSNVKVEDINAMDTDNKSILSDCDNRSQYSEWSVSYSDNEEDNNFDECFSTNKDEDDTDDDFKWTSDYSDLIEECDNEDLTFRGKRIVDLNLVFNEIRKINSHSNTCNFNDMRLAKREVKMGFVSNFRFKCSKCAYVHVIKTSENRNDKFDLNYESVLGAMSIGIGFSQLQQFTGILDVPCMTAKSFANKEKKIQVDVTGAAEASMKLSADEEKEYATAIGTIRGTGIPQVKGVCDAARSTNYSALSGSAVITGHKTQKVLWHGVGNKFCSICQLIESGKKEPYNHDCNKNYEGRSTGMEAKVIVDGFRECEESSRGNLRKLGEKGFLKRYLTTAKIEEIIKDMRCAAKHWIEEQTSMEEKIANLSDDIYNVPFHVFGCHKKCKDYFCTKKNSDEVNVVDILKANGSFNSILDALSRARLNARSILLNETSNIAEQFNTIIGKYTGGKRVNLAKSNSLNGRAKLAALQHDTGRSYSALCEYMKKVPNVDATKNEIRRLVKKLRRSDKVRQYHPKTVSSGSDKNYGQSSSRTDMDLETFKFGEINK